MGWLFRRPAVTVVKTAVDALGVSLAENNVLRGVKRFASDSLSVALGEASRLNGVRKAVQDSLNVTLGDVANRQQRFLRQTVVDALNTVVSDTAAITGPGILSLEFPSYNVNEESVLSFRITRGNGDINRVRVTWTVNLSAGSPTPATGTVTFNDRDSASKTVQVNLGALSSTVVGTIVLSNPVNLDGGSVPSLGTNSAALTVQDVVLGGLGFVPAKVLTYQSIALGADAVGSDAMLWVFDQQRGIGSTDIPGPFGSTRVMRNRILAGTRNFGGSMYRHNAPITPGQRMWIRKPVYFADNWFFRYRDQAGQGQDFDGYGATKWLRLQWGADDWSGPRGTLQLGGFSHNTADTQAYFYGMSLEGGPVGESWIYFDQSMPGNVINKGSWQFLQWEILFSPNPSVGYVRFWIGDTFIGQVNGYTMPSSTANLYDIRLGDYYNGGVTVTQDLYLDNVVISFATPADVDSGGRPYIAANRNAEGVTPLFEDTYESGVPSGVQNGIQYGNTSGNVAVVSGVARTGNNSYRFRHAASSISSDGTTAERRFRMATVYPELWCSFDMLLPANYVHRGNKTHVGSNNKWLVAWQEVNPNGNDGYSDPSTMTVGLNVWAKTPTANCVDTYCSLYMLGGGHDFHIWDFIPDCWSPADFNIWRHYVMRFRAATGPGNGICQVWKDGILIGSRFNIDSYVPAATGYNRGYLNGWANTGFAVQTDIHYDNFRIHNAALP